MAFQRACNITDLVPGQALKVDLAGQGVLLIKDGDQVHASSSVCIHRGGDLSSGEMQGSIITCPLHFWKFDLNDGICVQVPSVKLKTFPVKLENGLVWVDA